MSYRYQFAKGGAKDLCPACGQECRKPTWKRYVDTETEELMPIEYGKCNRKDSCGHKNTPYGNPKASKSAPPPPPKPISTHPESWVTHSQQFWDDGNLYQFLKPLFGQTKVEHAFNKYNVGVLQSEKQWFKEWNGSAIFWGKNKRGEVLGGKVMQYDHLTGKRAKNAPYGGIIWVHALHKLADFNLGKYLFGEHLLSEYPTMPIGIVESEKTAIIASMMNNEYLWLATGGKENLQAERLISVSDRKIILFPDYGAEESWILKKHDILRRLPKMDIHVSTEVNAEVSKWYLPPEFEKKGFDLGDYYILRAKYPNFDPLCDFNPDAHFDDSIIQKSEKALSDDEIDKIWSF